MARITVAPGLSVHVEVDDYLWPWTTTRPRSSCSTASRETAGSGGAGYRLWPRTIACIGRTSAGTASPTSRTKTTLQHRRPDERPAQDRRRPRDSQGALHRRVGGGIFSVLFASNTRAGVQRHAVRFAHGRLGRHPKRLRAGRVPPGAAMLKLGLAEWCRQTLSYRLDVSKASPELQEWYISEIGKICRASPPYGTITSTPPDLSDRKGSHRCCSG